MRRPPSAKCGSAPANCAKRAVTASTVWPAAVLPNLASHRIGGSARVSGTPAASTTVSVKDVVSGSGGLPSSAAVIQITSDAGASPSRGVPENVLVAASNPSQPGSALPSDNAAE